MTLEQRYYTNVEVARMFSVTVGTVRRWIREDKLEAVKMNNFWRVSSESIQKFSDDQFSELHNLRHLHDKGE